MIDWRYREEEVEPNRNRGLLTLLHGCLLRTIGWSVLAWVLLGPIFVVIEIGRGLGIGALVAGGSWLIFQVSVAAAQRALLGTILGATTGLVLAAVTLTGVVPRRPVSRYRRGLGMVGTTTSIAGLLGLLYVFDWPNRLPVVGLVDLRLWLAGTGLAGWWVGLRVASWYVAETAAWDEG